MLRRILSQGDHPGAPPESRGAAVTAVVVALNVLLILLLSYFLFRRFFSPKRIENDDDDDDSSAPPSSSSAESSPASSTPRSSSRLELSPLPVFVHRCAADGGVEGAVDCAVCLAGFQDGEIGRVLPQCNHRFHAECVDMWLRLGGACPLCRTAVAAAAAEADGCSDHQEGLTLELDG